MAGIAATGTLLKMGSTPTTIVNVTDIGGPQYSAETIDVTAHDSTGSFREILPTFLSAGEVPIDFNFDPSETTHKDAAGGIFDVFHNKTEEDFVIALPDGVIECAFKGYITGLELSFPYDDKASGSMTITISGKPTWTYI